MVTLPDPGNIQRSIPSVQTGVRSLRGADAVAQATQRLGNTVKEIGDLAGQRQATAMAKERDTYVGDQIRELMYNPESGFLTTKGRNAVDGANEIEQKLQQIEEEAGRGLNGMAQRGLQGQLERRLQSARDQVARHVAQENETWIEGASQARIASAQQDAILDTSKTDEAIATIEGEVLDWGFRGGKSAEEIELEMDRRVSEMFGQQVERLASMDPMMAMTHLQLNKDDILPEVYADLEAALRPEVRRYRGRQAGASAAAGELSGSRDAYYDNIRAAESGGDDNARNPNSSATGRYQFTSGTWADMMAKHPELGLTADGRTDPSQQEMAIRAFTEDNERALAAAGIPGTNGNLYAAHFLGAGDAKTVLRENDFRFVSDLVSPQVIEANPFLRNMTVGEFKDWTVRKAGGAAEGEPQRLSDLLAIEDPDERQAALSEYNLVQGVAGKEQAAAQQAAMEEAWNLVEEGGNVNNLSRDARELIGFSNMRQLQAYQSGRVQTDPAFYTTLIEMSARDPQAFMEENPMEWWGRLDPADYNKMLDRRAKMISGDDAAVQPRAVSSMLSTADAALRSAGIQKTKQPEEYAAFQRALTDWASANPADSQDPIKLQAEINRQLQSVVIDPQGWGWNANKQKGYAFEMDFDGEPLDPSDDMTLEELLGATIKIGGDEVPENVLEAVMVQSVQQLGRDPTAAEVFDALSAYMASLQ